MHVVIVNFLSHPPPTEFYRTYLFYLSSDSKHSCCLSVNKSKSKTSWFTPHVYAHYLQSLSLSDDNHYVRGFGLLIKNTSFEGPQHQRAAAVIP